MIHDPQKNTGLPTVQPTPGSSLFTQPVRTMVGGSSGVRRMIQKVGVDADEMLREIEQYEEMLLNDPSLNQK
jgi:hypothetical protein